MGLSRTSGRRAAQASIKGRRVRFPSRSRRAAGAVTRSALIWLIAQVLPSVAESLATYCCAEADGYSIRIIFTWSAPVLGVAVAVPARYALAAASASMASSLPSHHSCQAIGSQIDPFGSLPRRGSPHPEAHGSDRPYRSWCLQSRRRGWSQTPRSRRSDRRIPRSVLHVDPSTEIEYRSAAEEVLSGIRPRQWLMDID